MDPPGAPSATTISPLVTVTGASSRNIAVAAWSDISSKAAWVRRKRWRLCTRAWSPNALPWTEARKGHLLTVVVHEDPDGALYDQVHAVGLVAGREDRFAELEGAGLKEPDDERLQSRRQTGEKRQRSQHLLLLALPGRSATATAAGASGADATGGAVQSPGVLSHLCAQRGPTRITRPARARSSTSPRSSDLA